jgi:hypothetical protein
MEKTARLQLGIGKERRAILDQLMKDCGLKTEQELFDIAMTLFQWAVDKRKQGYDILASNMDLDPPEDQIVTYGLRAHGFEAIKRSSRARKHLRKFGQAKFTERELEPDIGPDIMPFTRGSKSDKGLPPQRAPLEEKEFTRIDIAVTKEEATALNRMMKDCGFKKETALFIAAVGLLWQAVEAGRQGAKVMASNPRTRRGVVVEMPVIPVIQ